MNKLVQKKRHQLTQHVKLLQKAVIKNQDGKVLILKRSSTVQSRPDCWDLPGGNSEWPEHVKSSQANLHHNDIVREIEEETGIKVEKHSFSIQKILHFSTYYEFDKKVYTIIVGWLVSYKLDNKLKDICLSNEHQNYVWLDKSKLNKYDFGGEKGVFIVDMIKQAYNRQLS
jgi:8-oxo-dGTP pyrophosphatase MutT (NUDIX family)